MSGARDDVALLRSAARRLADLGGIGALEARANGNVAALLAATADRMAREVSTWEGIDRLGRSKMTIAEKVEKFYGLELGIARSVLSGNVAPLTSEERLMVREREEEIERLRGVLFTVIGALRDGQDVEQLEAYIRGSVDSEGPRPLTSAQRYKLRKGEACPSGKKPFLSRSVAREFFETVVLRNHDVAQRPYQCNLCPCIHLFTDGDAPVRAAKPSP